MGVNRKSDRHLFAAQVRDQQIGTELPEDATEEEAYLHGPERLKESKYANPFEWYIAEQYEPTDDRQIRVASLGSYKSYKPLEDTDLFRSFIRTSNNERLFDERIKEWVDNHGLLQSGYLDWLKQYGRLHRGFPGDLKSGVLEKQVREARKELLNQTPIRLDLFKREVREARNAAELYYCLYNREFPAIEDWAEDLLETMQERELDPIEEALLPRGGSSREQSKSLNPNRVAKIATNFQTVLTQKISEVQLSLPDLEPWDFFTSGRRYMPRISYHCPDLWSAVWLQFYLAVTERLPTRRCANPECQIPFPSKKRSDAKTCSRACRLKIHRNRKKSSS